MNRNPVDSDILTLFAEIPEGKYSLQHLGDNRSQRCAQDAVFFPHQGDQQGIQRNIQECARCHDAHGDFQLAFTAHDHIGGLGKVDEQGTDKDHLQVSFRLRQDFTLRAGEGQETGGKEFTDRGDNQGKQDNQAIRLPMIWSTVF